MSESSAWILDFGAGVRAAVGEFNLVHLVHQPELFEIPATPPHCRRVLAWQAGLLPVWDLLSWLGHRPGADEGRATVAGVVGFQRRSQVTPEFGVFLLSRPPYRAALRDADVCAIPCDPPGWGEVALSCVAHTGEPLPILDLRRILSDALVSH